SELEAEKRHLFIRNREINTNPLRRDVLNRIIGGGDRNCIWELRMSIDALGRLCELLKVQGGLSDECRLSIPGQICYRSGETISRYFNKVLYLVIRVQRLLFAKAVPIPDDFIDPRWKWFKSCLGELDGTYIDVTVPKKDKSRYRARKVDEKNPHQIQESLKMLFHVVITSGYQLGIIM
ncbi:hypothetical protein S83_031603, partial [Arachis hypogaea]